MSKTRKNPQYNLSCDCPSADECKTVKTVRDFHDKFPGSHVSPRMYNNCKRTSKTYNNRKRTSRHNEGKSKYF